jgi:hypothetical protein
MSVGEKVPARRADAVRIVVMVGAVEPNHGADSPLLAGNGARLAGGIAERGHPSLVRLMWLEDQARTWPRGG